MDYKKLAQEIVANVGDVDNIRTLSHCITRLRFQLRDASEANKEALENLEGVLGAVCAGGQYMVILGQHLLRTYDVMVNDFSITSGDSIDEDLDDDLAPKEPWTWEDVGDKIISFISSSVTPMTPGPIAGGMLKAVLLLVVTFIDSNFATSSNYLLLSAIVDAPFYFIPIFVAYGAANKLGAIPICTAALAVALLHGNFTNLVTASDPITLFGISVHLLSYGISLLPTLLIAILAYCVRKFLNKVIPNIFKAILVGMGTIFVAGSLGFIILDPLGSMIGQDIASLFMFLEGTVGPVAMGSLATALPWMAIARTHTALTPFMAQLLTSPRYDATIRPALLLHNMTEGDAVIGVTTRTKDRAKRDELLSIAVDCIVAGVAEPAIYGVDLKYKKPICGVIAGGFVGGIVVDILGVKAYEMGYSNILALPIFGKTVLAAVAGITVVIVVATVVTYLLGTDTDKEDAKLTVTGPIRQVVSDDAILAIADGELVPLEKVDGKVFAQELMGDGIAFKPASDFTVVPTNDELTTISPTEHAFDVTRPDGVELLAHINISTVGLNGEGFGVLARTGDSINAGQPIVRVDRDKINQKGYDATTMLIITNANGKTIELPQMGDMRQGQRLGKEES